ncbi:MULTISPECIES: YdaS family helix-turn-helix protein [unclassified Serratia (in: enterobacteria)]|uniref:YdaS family helix-turn-helix protein n=1 Tax=unclassified Serratia (in: enterobacteria) TaxID=2647522 RepID=UPI00046A7613|nr:MULTISPECIES: YdaS family helix-turn-helix protein [unclassified Serratia (in: enterobacteria)]
MNEAIQKAVSIAGGQQKLASLCGVSQPTVWRWLHGGGINMRYVKRIIKATGGEVKAAEISPDLADLLDS